MSCFPREVITIQVGHYSNFIGSHWWNLQEASFAYTGATATGISHDYLFREGRLPNDETSYTPRLLIIDRKGSLGSLPVAGLLYEPVIASPCASDALWAGDVDIIRQIPEERNEFLRTLDEEDAQYLESLDEDKDVCFDDISEEHTSRNLGSQKICDLSIKVKVWSDYLRTHLHYKTVYILNDCLHHEEEEGTGWGFLGGAAVMKKQETEEEAADRLRILAESCESLQGFQLLSDGHNGMGGVSWTLAQHIADEYSSKDLFSFISTPSSYKPTSALETSLYLSSIVQCYTELSKLSSLVTPLTLQERIWDPASDQVKWPHLSYEMGSPYETSSILAAFLETVSTPFRNKLNPLTMNDYSYLLTSGGRKVVSGSLAFPVGLEEGEFLADWLMTKKDFNFVPVSGGYSSHLEALSEIHAIRGIPPNRLVSSDTKLPGGIKFSNAWELYKHFLEESDVRSVMRHVDGITNPLITSAPYPQFFHKEVNEFGFVQKYPQPFSNSVCSVPTAATLNQGKGIARILNELYTSIVNIDVSKVSKLVEEELDKEAWNDVKENFRQLLNCYDLSRFSDIDGMDNGDDDDDDDNDM